MKYAIELSSILVAGSIFLSGCGPTYEEGSDARLRVNPANQVTFSRVKTGETRTQPVMISNVGHDPLKVSHIEWRGAENVRLSVEGSSFPRILDTRGQFSIAVHFAPTTTSPTPDGVIRIYSNDINHPEYDLPVVAQQLAPQIHVVPSAEEKLIFGQVDAGQTATKTVVVTNSGDLPLEISQVALQAPSDFSYEVVGVSGYPVSLLSGESRMDIKVSFTPSSTGRMEGNLVFHSNDPSHPTYTLPIVANSDTPCIKVQPVIVEFNPAVSVNTTATRDVTLTSCSSVPLTITSVMKASGEAVFGYELIGADEPLSEGGSATLKISYTPDREGTHKAEYVVVNNDPLQPNATVTVMGTSSANQCPTAVARARILAASDWGRTIDAAPLDTITFDGALSHDVESNTLKYYWTIRSAPKDSTSKLAISDAQATLFADLAGTYVVCLNVEDSGGMLSCNEDCLTVTAIPRETIHLQLVWHTPADLVSDDDGTDLDLHFVRMLQGNDTQNARQGIGTWGDKGIAVLNDGTDVYFENREPVWSVEGFGNELPSLDRDDKDGDGPENINLDNPSPCTWYAIGVHYYQDAGFMPSLSYATLRVYIDGKLLHEQANVSLAQTGAFKQLALLHWNGSSAHIYKTTYAYTSDDEWIGKEPIIPEDVLEKAKASSPQCFEK